MLVKFTSSTAGQMIMLGEHAHMLFELMGKIRSAKGVFQHEQIHDAVVKLKKAVTCDKKNTLVPNEKIQGDDKKGDSEESKEEAVSLAQRAQPLIHLMERTLKEGGFILWEAPDEF